MRRAVLLALVLAGGCGKSDDPGSTTPTTAAPTSTLGFFVSSSTSTTGNLGGLRGADARCQTLAAAVGAGGRTWRAYLSVERDADNGNQPTDARSRIGSGPWLKAGGAPGAGGVARAHASREGLRRLGQQLHVGGGAGRTLRRSRPGRLERGRPGVVELGARQP